MRLGTVMIAAATWTVLASVSDGGAPAEAEPAPSTVRAPQLGPSSVALVVLADPLAEAEPPS